MSKIASGAVAMALYIACFGPLAASAAGSPRATLRWMPGFAAPGTPARYDKVGVVAVGPAKAKNVLVLEPGTSAGGGYFVPLAKWIVAKAKGWQVWSVERRENLLEDQSELNLAKRGKRRRPSCSTTTSGSSPTRASRDTCGFSAPRPIRSPSGGG